MKRKLLVAMTVIMCTTALAGCGKNDLTNGNPQARSGQEVVVTMAQEDAPDGAVLGAKSRSVTKRGIPAWMDTILDVEAYRAGYPDLQAAFGNNTQAYVTHFLTYGCHEGRGIGVHLNPVEYAEAYSDIKAAFGDDLMAIMQHYVTYGKAEGRTLGTSAGYQDIADRMAHQTVVVRPQGGGGGSHGGSHGGGSSAPVVVPTAAPTVAPEAVPTVVPTESPVTAPTEAPVSPTAAPGDEMPVAPGVDYVVVPEKIKAMEQHMVDMINEHRRAEGLHEYEYDMTYYACARIRANEMEILFSHTRPDGSKFSTVFAEQGVVNGRAMYGENIARYYPSVEAAMEAFMNSPGHRRNIMDGGYTKVCIAIKESAEWPGYYAFEQLFIYDKVKN